MLYEYNPNTLQAMRVASMRSLGFQGGARSILWRGVKSVIAVPGSMAMGMGLGLASSRISERFLENIAPGMDPVTRYHLSATAFFAPNIYHLGAGNRGLAVLESSTFRKVGRAFSLGFMADLAFMGIHSLFYGNQASEMRWQNHLISANREQREHRGLFSMHGVFSLLSPELAAWWDAR